MRNKGPAHCWGPTQCLQTGALLPSPDPLQVFFVATVKIRKKPKQSVTQDAVCVCACDHQGAALSCSSTVQLSFPTHTNKDITPLGLPDWPGWRRVRMIVHWKKDHAHTARPHPHKLKLAWISHKQWGCRWVKGLRLGGGHTHTWQAAAVHQVSPPGGWEVQSWTVAMMTQHQECDWKWDWPLTSDCSIVSLWPGRRLYTLAFLCFLVEILQKRTQTITTTSITIRPYYYY